MTKRTFYDLVGEELFPNGVYPQPEIDELNKKITELQQSIKRITVVVNGILEMLPIFICAVDAQINYLKMKEFRERGVGICQIRPMTE